MCLNTRMHACGHTQSGLRLHQLKSGLLLLLQTPALSLTPA